MTSFLRLAWDLQRLGRSEGPLLGGLLVLVGYFLSGGTDPALAAFSAVSMGGVAMSFVYGLNGITDVDEDRLNSPDRPLPDGRVSAVIARRYVGALLLVGVIYPVALYSQWLPRAIVYALLIIGAAYSQPPVRLKARLLLATPTVAVLLHLPLALGIVLASEGLGGGSSSGLRLPLWILATFGFCLATLPIKDIEDMAGDRACGIQNWVSRFGPRPVVRASAVSLCLLGAVTPWVLTDAPHLRVLLAAFCFVGAALMLLHLALGWQLERLYRRIVRMVVVLAAGVALVGSVWSR